MPVDGRPEFAGANVRVGRPGAGRSGVRLLRASVRGLDRPEQLLLEAIREAGRDLVDRVGERVGHLLLCFPGDVAHASEGWPGRDADARLTECVSGRTLYR